MAPLVAQPAFLLIQQIIDVAPWVLAAIALALVAYWALRHYKD
ncbi:hypothetical protein ACFOW6_01600 [Fodinicurvata halophila]|uniref:Uncharacterized protein n=1 Tax=Fodinicurvata halophila TaxID=1419723 RepID=A0ABV8UG25_9PROT